MKMKSHGHDHLAGIGEGDRAVNGRVLLAVVFAIELVLARDLLHMS